MIFFIVHGSLAFSGDDSETKKPVQPIQYELGISHGTPGIFNLSLGIWGWGPVPLVARVSGMYFGHHYNASFGSSKAAGGVQFEMGWCFDCEGDIRQFVSLGFLVHRLNILHTDRPWFVKEMLVPFYGFIWRGFFIQLGIAVYNSGASGHIPGQMGYLLFF